MGRLIYAAVSYLLFLATFAWLFIWINSLGGPITVDAGREASTTGALLVDLPLLALFGVQHSVMARPGFKRVWTQIVPASIERATFVLASSLVLLAIFALWRPLPDVVWNVGTGTARLAVWALQLVGWLVVLASTFMTDHFHLFGLSQAWASLRAQPPAEPTFRRVLLYAVVRHPMMLGIFIAFWAAPVMTVGHVVFDVAMTAYVVIGVYFEERDMVRLVGADYDLYRAEVRKFVPIPRARR